MSESEAAKPELARGWTQIAKAIGIPTGHGAKTRARMDPRLGGLIKHDETGYPVAKRTALERYAKAWRRKRGKA